jgi:hypothetical protein
LRTTSRHGSTQWNDDPGPFTWTKTADEILKSLADYLNKINPPTTENQQRT